MNKQKLDYISRTEISGEKKLKWNFWTHFFE